MSPAKVPQNVEDRIEELVLEGSSTGEIHRQLVSEMESPPSERTIRRRVTNMTPAPEAEPWSLSAEQDPDDASLLLRTLEAVIERSEGRRITLSEDEAAWILKLRSVARSLPRWESYRLARLYIERKTLKEGTADLDAYLALAPWGGDSIDRNRWSRYWAMVAVGRIPEPPGVLFMDPEWRYQPNIAALDSMLIGLAARLISEEISGVSEETRRFDEVIDELRRAIVRKWGAPVEDAYEAIDRSGAVRERARGFFKRSAEVLSSSLADLFREAGDFADEHPSLIDAVDGLTDGNRDDARRALIGMFIAGNDEVRRGATDLLLPDLIHPLVGFDKQFYVLDEESTIPEQLLAWERELSTQTGEGS